MRAKLMYFSPSSYLLSAWTPGSWKWLLSSIVTDAIRQLVFQGFCSLLGSRNPISFPDPFREWSDTFSGVASPCFHQQSLSVPLALFITLNNIFIVFRVPKLSLFCKDPD